MASGSKSLFSSINNGFMGNKGQNNAPYQNGVSNGHNGHQHDDDMEITAGIGFPSKCQAEGRELTGSFVKAKVNGHHPPTDVKTSVIKQSSNGQREVTPKPTTPIAQRRHGDIANVSFSQATQQSHGHHREADFSIPDPHPTFQIYVKREDTQQRRPFIIRGTDTVEYVKELARDAFNVSLNLQCLTYCGYTLDDKQTLEDLRNVLEPELLLQVKYPQYTVYARALLTNNQKHAILVCQNYTVKTLKDLIFEKTRINQSQQTLVCNGRTLHNEYTLEYYGITAESFIDVTGQLRGG